MGLLPRRLKQVFEFRHKSWYEQDGLDLLRRHGVGLCVQDMPGSVAHGRDGAVRVLPLPRRRAGVRRARYSENALEEWASRMRGLEDVEEVWAFFNNDIEACAVDNAQVLSQLLQGPE